jgi:hypothetical protein
MRTKLLPHAVRLTDDSQCRGAWRYDCDGAFNVYFRFENVNDDARFKVRWNGQQQMTLEAAAERAPHEIDDGRLPAPRPGERFR